MNSLIEPNLHPLIVHFVIAFLMTGPLLLFLTAVAPRHAKWRSAACNAGDWMLGLGLLASLVAVAAGFQAYYSVAHDGPSHAAMTDHRNWALGTVALFLVIGSLRLRTRRNVPTVLFAILLLLPVGLLAVTGWKGGHLVYRHGLGVASLPAVTGEGHDHEHAPGQEHTNFELERPTSEHLDTKTGHDDAKNAAHHGEPEAMDDQISGHGDHDHTQHDH